MKAFLSLLACAGAASAQNLSSVLAANNSTLSALAGLIQMAPDLMSSLENATHITVLAPNNDAIAKFTAANKDAIAADPGLVTALLQYHVLNQTVKAADITSAGKPLFPQTLLTNRTYVNITGGQYLEASSSGNKVVFTSGMGSKSQVVTADVNFTGGVLHVIETVLTIPSSGAKTAAAAGLTSLASSLNSTGLLDAVMGMGNLTIFAPSNDAFASISSVTASASNTTLQDVLKYHVVNSSVIFSTDLSGRSEIQTLGGGSIKVHQEGGKFFVNNALITAPNKLISNGVLHVVDEVLNPQNSTSSPASDAKAGQVMFGGATGTTNGSSPSSSTSPSSSSGFGSGSGPSSGAGPAASAGFPFAGFVVAAAAAMLV